MTHESEKKQYEADAQWHPRPWELWEVIDCGIEATLDKPPVWHPDNTYRRKPDAPERNCAMCKLLFKCHGNKWLHFDYPTPPDWCPLTQKEEPKQTDLLTAARDLLEGLQGVIMTRGDEKIEALRKAVERCKSI